LALKPTGKAALKVALETAKVKAIQAQTALNATVDGKGLTGDAYKLANDKFIAAGEAVKAAQTALNNYKEPVKTKSAKQVEDERQKAIREGKDPNALPEGATGPTGPTGSTGATGATGGTGNVPLEDFIKNLDVASAQTINEIKGYLGVKKLDGILDYATISAIYAKEQEIETVADATGRAVDRLTYYKTNAKTGGTGVVPYGTISSATEAAAKINDVWQAELFRDATDEEIKKYTPILNDAEKKNLTKTVNGITTGGLNKVEFLTQIVKKLPEFTVKKSDKIVDAKAKLTATALANGFNLESNFTSELPGWLDAIDKGQKVDKFQQTIRNAARRLLPEGIRNQIDPEEDLSTTFATYRNNYAKSRGVPANTVSLEKIIPMATTDKGFATNREFEVNKRKDPSWDTSDEAIGITYAAIDKIKSNWGF